VADASFGRGYPDCSYPKVTLSKAGGLRVVVHRELADLFSMLIDLTEMMGYDIQVGQTWGAACRPIRGTQTPSNHSWGTALDINSLQNPQRRPIKTNMPKRVVDLWKNHGFRWGGDYQTSTPDPMHMEFMGTVAQARAITARLRAFLEDSNPATPKPPATPPALAGKPAWRKYPGPVRLGMGTPERPSPAVKVWQQLLVDRGYRLKVDGVFGLATNHVVMDWQRKHGLKIDGIGGTATWHQLLYG